MNHERDGSHQQTVIVTRITVDSQFDYLTTRSRLDSQLPRFDPGMAEHLVASQATPAEVEEFVASRTGPTGLVAVGRVDQGSFFSLLGTKTEATQYVVGNPVVAARVLAAAKGAALVAPFPMAVYADDLGAPVSYHTPDTLFRQFGLDSVDAIAADLNRRVRAAVVSACSDYVGEPTIPGSR